MGPPEYRMKSAETPSKPPVEAGRNGDDSSKPGPSGEAGVGLALPTPTEDHLSKRIFNSAIGLTSSAQGTGSLGSLRPEDIGVGGKGSSAGPSNSANRTTADQAPVRHGAGSSETFRSRHDGKDESERPFQEFIGVASRDFEHGAFTMEALSGGTKHPSVQERTIETQEAQDGEEVAALLSDPTSIHFTDDVDFGAFSAQLPPRLRASLFSDKGMPSSTWDHLLNFWPVADDSLALESSYPGGKPAWLAQWKDVLTSYTDEVWGELTTDAMRAKEEVETLQEEQGSDTGGLESLRRLRQILAHLRGT